MDPARLRELGLTLHDTGAGPEAVLALGGALKNPLTRRALESATFAVAEDRLIPLEPPELAGLPALEVSALSGAADVERQLATSFQRHISALQRGSAELKNLGATPKIDTQTLELAAEVVDAKDRFFLTGPKSGGLRLAVVERDGQRLPGDLGPPFDLADFASKEALLQHLRSLVAPAGVPRHEGPTSGLPLAELVRRFGGAARVPDAGSVDLLVVLKVRGEQYRFAATRLRGRTFRGLLAGPAGKVWAAPFELDAFLGVAEMVGAALGVPAGAVELFEEGA